MRTPTVHWIRRGIQWTDEDTFTRGLLERRITYSLYRGPVLAVAGSGAVCASMGRKGWVRG